MTIAIAARSAEAGMFGIAISSSSPAVAARCAHARAGVGVLGTQNITDPRLGPAGLDLMAKGLDAEEAIATLCRTAPHIEFRQLIAVDRQIDAVAACRHDVSQEGARHRRMRLSHECENRRWRMSPPPRGHCMRVALPAHATLTAMQEPPNILQRTAHRYEKRTSDVSTLSSPTRYEDPPLAVVPSGPNGADLEEAAQ